MRNCEDFNCEFLKKKRVGDSFDRADEWKCGQTNRVICSYVEIWDLGTFGLPQSCPRRSEFIPTLNKELCKEESIKFTKNFPKYNDWGKRILENDRNSTKN